MKELNDYLFSTFGEEMYLEEENRRKIRQIYKNLFPTLIGMLVGSFVREVIKDVNI